VPWHLLPLLSLFTSGPESLPKIFAHTFILSSSFPSARFLAKDVAKNEKPHFCSCGQFDSRDSSPKLVRNTTRIIIAENTLTGGIIGQRVWVQYPPSYQSKYMATTPISSTTAGLFPLIHLVHAFQAPFHPARSL
jgi:hypothetical protein